MTVREQANVKVTLNNEEAKREVDELNSRIEKLIQLKKKAESEGDVKGFKQIDKELRSAQREAKKYERQLYDIEKALKNINGASWDELKQAEAALVAQTRKLNKETNEYVKKSSQLRMVRTELAKTAADQRTHVPLWSRMANGANKYFNVVMAGIATLTGIVFSVKEWVKGLVGLDDALADVQKTTGLTRKEARELYTEFKYFNTRTPRRELLALAEEAGRLGKTGKKDIMDFVEVANMIKVSLGDDLGGNAEEAIREVGKLVEIYKVGNQYGTDFKKSMEKVGSGINEVAASSNAQAPYLIEYMKRLGGIADQAKISAANIMGYAATFDQLGQNVEMAATAQSKVTIDMFTDPGKYAKIAGMEISDFSDLLNTDANEAFIKFLAGLNGNNEGLSVMAVKLDELGIDGARATQALAALSSNTEMLRKQQVISNKAMNEGVSLINEYNLKNNNLAGSVEKIGQYLHSKFVNSKFLGWMEKAIAKTAEWVKIPLSEKLRDEQTELNLLVTAVTNANNTQETRNALMDELEKKYPSFLENLDTENVTNEELSKHLENVNKQYENKILLAIKEESLQDNYRERVELKTQELQALKDIAKYEGIAAEARRKAGEETAPNKLRTLLSDKEITALNAMDLLPKKLEKI